LFWTTQTKTDESEDKTRSVLVKASSEWRDLKLVFQIDSPLATLRLDTENNGVGHVLDVDSIVLQTVDEEQAQALTQPANDPARFFGTPLIDREADMSRSRRVMAAMTPHKEMEIMRAPATTAWTDALAVQCGGEVGIGGHARRAQFVDQEAKVERRRGPDAGVRFHGVG
jgi:hypothetical protein